MSVGLVALLVAFFLALAVVWAIAYASRAVNRSMFEDRDDHELALSLSAARARRREGVGPAGAPGTTPAVSPLSAAESRYAGRRDDTIGVDMARAEVRERIRRYNTREMRR